MSSLLHKGYTDSESYESCSDDPDPHSDGYFHDYRDKRADIEYMMDKDEKDKFVELIKSLPEADAGYPVKKRKKLVDFLLIYSIENNAFHCAEALLKGETGLEVDLNSRVTLNAYPIHLAALHLSARFTELLIQYGAKSDKRCASDFADVNWLPIELALQAVRKRVWWTQDQSVFRLLFMLCGDGMCEPRDTLSLLTGIHRNSGLNDFICRYAAEGKIIEFAALYLIFLSDWYFSPRKIYMPADFKLGKQMTLCAYVIDQVTSLYEEEAKLILIDSSQLVKCREKKQKMICIMVLLGIFERSGECMSQHLRGWKSQCGGVDCFIATALESAEFQLTDEDLENVDLLVGHQERLSEEDLETLFNTAEQRLEWLSYYKMMADSGWNKHEPEHKKQHPLRMALESLCSKRITCHWTPKESPFKLITLLCLPKMKEALDTCRIFVDKKKRIYEIACCYAKEGKTFALAILLLLAREKVIDPIISEVKDDDPFETSMTFRQFIHVALAQSIDFENWAEGRFSKEAKMLYQLCGKRKSALISSLMVLEIFEKAALPLEDYLKSRSNDAQKEHVVRDVMKLLQESGFNLEHKDIEISNSHYCSMVKALDQWHSRMQKLNKDAGKTTVNGSLDEAAIVSPSVLQGTCPDSRVLNKSAWGMPSAVKSLVKSPLEASSFGPPVLPCAAFWTSKANYSSGSPKVSGLGLKRSTGHRFLTSNQLASVCLMLKKGIKRV